MNKMRVIPALALALLAWTPRCGALTVPGPIPTQGPVFQLSNLTFDHTMLVNMVNSAIQNNGIVNSFNAGPDAGVVSVTIRNVGGQAGYCYLIPVIKQAGSGQYNCNSGGTAVSGPLLQTRTLIQPGQTLIANIASFNLASAVGFNGSICQGLQNLLQNNFGGNGGSSVGGAIKAENAAVSALQQLELYICLEVSNANGALLSGAGDQACTSIAVFERPPSAMTSLGQVLLPNDTGVSTNLPTFVWTPSIFNGTSSGLAYELVLSQDANGDPWYGVQVPGGQTFYQYQATDRALQPGVKYWFHIVTLQSGRPLGGSNGQGWNQPQSWFTYAPMGTASATVTLAQLAALVQQSGSQAVVQALQGMQVQSVLPATTLNDPDSAALVAKPAEIKNISVEKF